MGVNNIFKFLRQNLIELDSVPSIEGNYELYVDLAIIIVPLMQRARNISHFKELLVDTFSRSSSELVSLMLRASTVFIFLDMLSPRMKIETRVRRSLRQSVVANARAANGAAVSADGCVCGVCPACVEANRDRGAVRYNVVKLRDVRSIMADIIVRSMCTLDPSFALRCFIETDVIGEGEIKCIRSAIYRARDPALRSARGGRDPTIAVLSNDNDVIIMMLMHQYHSLSKLAPSLFYRIMFNELTLDVDTFVAPLQYRVEIQRVSVDRFSLFRTTPYASRWRLLLWLICCCGTDFVPPIRPFSVNRRVYIFNACLRLGHARQRVAAIPPGFGAPPMPMYGNGYGNNGYGNGFGWPPGMAGRDCSCGFINGAYGPVCGAAFSMTAFLEELRWFVGLVRNVCSCSIRSAPRGENDRASNAANVTKVAAWIIRLYWNILYVIDLPIDFYVEQRFATDLSMYVNCYVPDEYISIFSLLHHLSDARVLFLRRVIDKLLSVSSERITLRSRC